jgi:hypothetical protein
VGHDLDAPVGLILGAHGWRNNDGGWLAWGPPPPTKLCADAPLSFDSEATCGSLLPAMTSQAGVKHPHASYLANPLGRIQVQDLRLGRKTFLIAANVVRVDAYE